LIAFGCSVNSQDVYRRCAQQGIELASEADSRVFTFMQARTVPGTYNLILDRAAALPALEALVLVHEDAEIVGDDFAAKLRRAFADPSVAVVGCVGATGARSIAWWDSLTWTSAPYRYDELGGGEILWPDEDPRRAPGPVATVYGVLLALSPWAVRNLRFDESIGSLHGYDFDICAQARAAGHKVLAIDLRVSHHHSLDLVQEEELFLQTHIRAAEKWDRAELSEAQWRARARTAEADAGTARLLFASTKLRADALESIQNARLEEIRASRSWRLTEPLRRGNAILRRARDRLRPSAALQHSSPSSAQSGGASSGSSASLRTRRERA
jgi:Glycosyltransferase like family